MADAPLTCADLDEIERAIGKSALGPGPLTLAKLVAMARQGIAAQALADLLDWLNRRGGLGYDAHDRISATLASFRAATSAPAPEYTREEMREACRNNYHAGAAVGADLAAQVAQLRADVAAMGNALADYFDNSTDYSTGANLRAIAERQGAKNG